MNLPKRYDLVTLLIGVNDQYRGGDAEAYRLEFRKMLQRTLHFAGGSVTPSANGSIPEGIAASIAKFNAVNREESAKSEVRYVDITPDSRVAVREPTLLVADGLHPSAAMYARWTALIVPSAQAALLER